MLASIPRILRPAAAAIAVGLLAAPAHAADSVVAWPVAPTMPANGGAYAQQFRSPGQVVGAVNAEFKAPAAFKASSQAVIEVSRETTPGQDGTLADDKRVAFGIAYPRDSDPTAFYGSVSAGAFLTPGTYYFQWSLRNSDYSFDTTGACPGWTPGASISCHFISPVFSFTVAAPAPAPAPAPSTSAPSTSGQSGPETQELGRGEAQEQVRDWLSERYRSWRRGKGRSVTCRATDYEWQRSCTAKWRYGRTKYQIKVIAQEYADSFRVRPGRLRRS